MKQIEWNSQCYQIDSKPDFLISGEFHYFRVPRKDWRTRLELFKQSGGNCVATYAPWGLHEPVEGEFHFGDTPERDLEGFLQLCKELDVMVLCRPGPYTYSELYYGGLPAWLCENYPELLARDVTNGIFRKESISYLHPVFLQKAALWFDAVCPIIARYTVANGGTVAFVQVDNELMGFHEWFGTWDYNVDSMGIGKETGRYPDFLKKRYSTIDAVDRAYGTQLESFASVVPVGAAKPQNVFERRRQKDYQEFYFDTVVEYVEILIKMVRERGIDSPIVHNSANPYMNSFFWETVNRLGNQMLLGSDHYYNLGASWDQNNPTPQYAAKVFYSNQMLQLMGFPPTIFELPAGSQANWPPLMPEDLYCCYMLNCAFGMKGFNYYIFTGGPDNPFTLSYKNNYDYGAPIAADGTIRPLYHALKKFHGFLKQEQWLSKAEMWSDFHIGLDWEKSRSKLYCNDRNDIQFSNVDSWNFTLKGVLISALNSSFVPAFVDLYKDDFTAAIDKPLFMPTATCMAAAIQLRLIAFVKNGGKLILVPVIPYLDENFNPCTLLQDFLDGASVESHKQVASCMVAGPVTIRFGSFTSTKRPIGAQTTATETTLNAESGWKVFFPGGGQVLWLGYDWGHCYNEHSEIFKYLLSESGLIAPRTRCDNPNIWAVVRSDGQHHILFVINLFAATMEATVSVTLPDGTVFKTEVCKLAPLEIQAIRI